MKSFFVMLMCARAAAALTVAEVQDNIRQQDRQIECVSFEYSQETRSSLSPEVVRVSGEAYFKKPNSLRVEQIKPERQLIVGSGKSVHLYTPRFNQVLRDSWKAWSRKNSFLPGLFGSSGTLERLKKDFRWSMHASDSSMNGDTVGVLLESKTKGSDERIRLWLGAVDFIPRKAEYSSGGLSLITTLASLKINPDLDPGLFQFVLPKGAVLIQAP
ncbi:MAG: hypothetical protein A2901_03720 [Elusimicrobia bacterium RIFCSPLOWO2_01_FULL_54_10]|nr:MAG: hypothetical protein A2901_03720 [Elusimicrobia bacterium RIFCSPLOWO2_01_FULL_54_10]